MEDIKDLNWKVTVYLLNKEIVKVIFMIKVDGKDIIKKDILKNTVIIIMIVFKKDNV